MEPVSVLQELAQAVPAQGLARRRVFAALLRAILMAEAEEGDAE